MVDYTTKQNNGGWAAGVYLAAAFVAAILLYGIFATGGPSTIDPSVASPVTLDAAPAADTAPAISE